MSGRGLMPNDVESLRDLVAAARAAGAPEAFPSTDDVASLLADGELAVMGRIWFTGAGSAAAWCLAQAELGNVLFDVHPDCRTRALEDDVLSTGVAALRQRERPSADTPLESDDKWRKGLLRRWGFEEAAASVVHLQARLTEHRPPVRLSTGWRVRTLGGDVDAYVDLHRAAFGTTYLTRERRLTWHDEPGYDPELDLVLVDADGRLVGFCVCWSPGGGSAELGTIGVLPDCRGRGLGRQIAQAALHKLAARGVREVTLSTSSNNAPMRAVAAAEGFVEQRRTSWLRRPTTPQPVASSPSS